MPRDLGSGASRADDRLPEVERLMAIFRPERVVHMGICVVSALFLLVCAVLMLLKDQWQLALGMFGATGAFTYSTGRLLKMWNDVIRILYGDSHADDAADRSATPKPAP